jgi:hypothetical protein
MNISIGTEIAGCFGAGLSEWTGKVASIEENTGLEWKSALDTMVKVVWEERSDGEDWPKEYTWLNLAEIRSDYFDPVLPSIGYFAVEKSFMEFVDNGGTINNG